MEEMCKLKHICGLTYLEWAIAVKDHYKYVWRCFDAIKFLSITQKKKLNKLILEKLCFHCQKIQNVELHLT